MTGGCSTGSGSLSEVAVPYLLRYTTNPAPPLTRQLTVHQRDHGHKENNLSKAQDFKMKRPFNLQIPHLEAAMRDYRDVFRLICWLELVLMMMLMDNR